MTLYDLAGGRDRLLAMTTAFYEKATRDDLIGAMFGAASVAHAAHLAGWLSASFGGPRDYLHTRGGLDFVVWKHAGLNITEAQRARWGDLMMEAAAETGMPDAFMQPYARFVDAITRSVRQNSEMPMEAMRARLGLAPGQALEPMVPDPDDAGPGDGGPGGGQAPA